jgi:pyruvate/2-oxoglutarate dehydrogenase complex dihydrolipoamide dehydrogenase (E3) component
MPGARAARVMMADEDAPSWRSATSPSAEAVQTFDAIVIGSGQAGPLLAMAFARAGMATALLDDGRHGGGVQNVGPTPSQALLATASVARLARRAGDFGIETGTVAVNLTKVQRRKHAAVEGARIGRLQALSDTPGLAVLEGSARFVGERSLEVYTVGGQVRRLQGERIFINSGVRPVPPELPGLSDVPHFDAESVLDLDQLPRQLLVMGGSDAGLELGQMFARFGSRVSIVEPGERLLPREDRDVAATVAQILREDGLEVFLETVATSVQAVAGGGVRLQVRNPAGSHALTGSHLLVVSGRAPNVGDMNLAAAGVELDDAGYVRVNERLETTAPGVYALGDVNGGPPFAHLANDDLRIVKANLLENNPASTVGRICPYTVFIDPPLARVGLTEAEARRQGRTVRVARLPMRRVARAVELNEVRGFMKVVVDAGSGRILGAAVLGVGGGEVMAMLQIAMMANMPYTALRDGVFAYPTMAESLNNLFTSLEK